MKDLDISHEITNVVGGAIAMGHLGATGGCLVSAMVDELERRNLKRAMLAMCRWRHGHINHYRALRD